MTPEQAYLEQFSGEADTYFSFQFEDSNFVSAKRSGFESRDAIVKYIKTHWPKSRTMKVIFRYEQDDKTLSEWVEYV